MLLLTYKMYQLLPSEFLFIIFISWCFYNVLRIKSALFITTVFGMQVINVVFLGVVGIRS